MGKKVRCAEGRPLGEEASEAVMGEKLSITLNSKVIEMGAQGIDQDLVIGLGVGLPLFLLVMGLLAATAYVYQKKKNQRKPRDANEKQSDDQHLTTKRRNPNDDYAHAIIHHNQAAAHETPDQPVYCNTINEAVYVNVSQKEAEPVKPSRTEAGCNKMLEPRSDQLDQAPAEPVYENLKRFP
ncbi:uncharacterized protein LOC144668480 [Cetorhinus maximus]